MEGRGTRCEVNKEEEGRAYEQARPSKTRVKEETANLMERERREREVWGGGGHIKGEGSRREGDGRTVKSPKQARGGLYTHARIG